MDIDITNGITEACVRRWAYDPSARFMGMEQDEETLLHDSRLFPVLIELAGDEACPKRQGICAALWEHTRHVGARCDRESARLLVEAVRAVRDRQLPPDLVDWIAYARRVLGYLFGPPRRADVDGALAMARDLLGGSASPFERLRAGVVHERYVEVSLPVRGRNEYLYVAIGDSRFTTMVHRRVTAKAELDRLLRPPR